jgi:sugar-specific transcriptional regulator TrmB
MDARLGEMKKTAVDTISRMTVESKQLVQTQRENLQETLNVLGTSSSDAVSTIRSSGNASAEELKNKVSEWRESIDESLRQTADATRETISTVTGEGKSQLDLAVTAGKDSIGSALGHAREQTRSQLIVMGEDLASALTDGAEGVSGVLAAAVSELETETGTLETDISSSFDAVGVELSERSIQSMARLEGAVKGVTDSLVSLTHATESEATSTLETSKGSIDAVNKKLVDSVTRLAGGHKDLAVKAVRSSLSASMNGLTDLQTRLSKIVESSWEDVGTTLASLKDSVNRIVADVNKSEMIGMTEETLAKVFPTSAPGDGKGAEIAKVLTSAWQTATATDFPGAKRTWTVVTRKAVLAHVQDMIERAKSKVTLIVPRADDVPAELLAKTKSTIGVEVVMTEEPKIPDRIRPLVGKGNIRIRSRAEKDVYACIRDSEEMLLAPVTTKEEDAIGVVTEEEGFVRFIMGTIGPIFQSKTKLLRPEDLH